MIVDDEGVIGDDKFKIKLSKSKNPVFLTIDTR